MYLETEMKNEDLIQTCNSKAVSFLAEETIIHSLRPPFRERFPLFCQGRAYVSVHASVLCYHGSPDPRGEAEPPITASRRAAVRNHNTDCFSAIAGMSPDRFAFVFLMELLEK